MKIHLIQINYKSGISMQSWYKDFTVTYQNSTLWSITHKVYQTQNKKNIEPSYMNVDAIESIWTLEEKEV